MPGVDDGARNAQSAVAAVEWMRDEGVRVIVATPHVEAAAADGGGVSPVRLAALDEGWAALDRAAAGTGVTVLRGAEVRLDVPDPDLSDARLRLDGGRFALVEFAYFVVPPRSTRVLENILAQGWIPVIAHPERYGQLGPDLAVAGDWRDAGAHLQVNGPSLLGRYGATAQSVAARLLASGSVAYLSSDYHARGAPRIAEVEALLAGSGGSAQADLLLRENPRRLLRGESPLPVPPLSVLSGV